GKSFLAVNGAGFWPKLAGCSGRKQHAFLMKDKSNTGAAPRSKRYASQEVGPWDGSSWETTAQPEVTYVSAEPDGTAFDAIGPPPAAFSPWPLVVRLLAQWHWLL